MNRKIQYRAFVKRLKIPCTMLVIRNQMLPVTGLHFWYGQELSGISVDSEEVGEIQDILLADHSNDVELLEGAGLNDVNGTPIFEGDIVRYKHAVEGIGVIILDGGFYIDIKKADDIADIGVWHIGSDDMIKLGTIYENPELLETTK